MPLWSRTSKDHTRSKRWGSQGCGTEEECVPIDLKVPLLHTAPSFCTRQGSSSLLLPVRNSPDSSFLLPSVFCHWDPPQPFPCVGVGQDGATCAQLLHTWQCQGSSRVKAHWGALAGGDRAAHMGQWVLPWSSLSFLLPCQVPADLPYHLLVQGWSEHGTRGPRRGTKHLPHDWLADCHALTSLGSTRIRSQWYQSDHFVGHFL